MTRSISLQRNTSETQIAVSLNLDEAGRGKINTGSGFLDHMLDLFQVHAGMTLEVSCQGDTHIDMHHSAEDIAIVLGQAILQAVGDKKGMERYGFYYIPMDEALARVVLDLSGRFELVWNVPLERESVGNMDAELFRHFFKSLAEHAKMNLHIDLLHGDDRHHCFEAIFKAFARALAMSVSPSKRIAGVPSSKGAL